MLGMLTIEGQLKLDHVQVIVTKFQMSSCIEAELFSTAQCSNISGRVGHNFLLGLE